MRGRCGFTADRPPRATRAPRGGRPRIGRRRCIRAQGLRRGRSRWRARTSDGSGNPWEARRDWEGPGRRGRPDGTVRIRDRRGRHQIPGVGMTRCRQHLRGRPALDDASEVHDRDAIAQVAHDLQVMGDEQQSEAHVAAQRRDQIEDLGLQRHVQGRCRLVGEHERRLEHDCARDGDALALSAAQLVRKARGVAGRETHRLEDLHDPVPARSPVSLAVDLERFGDQIPDAHAGIQRPPGVLEDHLHASTDRPALGPGGGHEVHAVEPHRAVRDGREPVDGPRKRRLSAPGLADETERFAAPDGEAHAVDGSERPGEPEEPLRRKLVADRKRFDFEKRSPHRRFTAHDRPASIGWWQCAR